MTNDVPDSAVGALIHSPLRDGAFRYTSRAMSHQSWQHCGLSRQLSALSSAGLTLLALLLMSAGCAGRFRTSGPSAAGPEITEASVRSHMEFLASDALNGRGSGTRDEWIAASYLSAQMRKWGLEPLGDAGGFIKTVNLESEEAVTPAVLTVGEVRFTHGKEMIATAITGARAAGRLQSPRLAPTSVHKPLSFCRRLTSPLLPRRPAPP